MSPTTARRLCACVHEISTNTYARPFNTISRWQQTARDLHHEERLALLQAEDHRLLTPVKYRIDKYQAQLDETRKLLVSLPATLRNILGSKGSALPLEKHNITIAEALASLDKLKDHKLPNLRAHVEDLQVEEYPEPGNTESEVDFLHRVRNMSDAERKDLLENLNMEIDAVMKRSQESRNNFREQIAGEGEWSDKPQQQQSCARMENPFAKTAAKAPVVGNAGKQKAESKPKVWMSTGEQFANVMADAALAADTSTPERAQYKAKSGMDEQPAVSTTWKPTEPAKPKQGTLHSLQAKLEASWKSATKR